MRLLIFSLNLYLINSCKGSDYIFFGIISPFVSLSLLILAYSVFFFSPPFSPRFEILLPFQKAGV